MRPDSWVHTDRAGLILPERVATNRDRPIAVDLFCGMGGFSLGLHRAGYHVVAAADSDPLCAMTYLYNLGAYPVQFYFVDPEDEERLEQALSKEMRRKKNADKLVTMPVSGGNKHAVLGEAPGCEHFFLGDISKLKGQNFLDALGLKRGDLDLVCGGPPCQGFSRANAKAGPEDPRNSLVFEFARLVVEMQPKAMIMENVPDLVRMTTPDGVPIMDELCRILEDGGMGPRDALRSSLSGTAGVGAAFRGRKKPHKANERSAKPRADEGQTDMFEAIGA